MMETTNSIETN